MHKQDHARHAQMCGNMPEDLEPVAAHRRYRYRDLRQAASAHLGASHRWASPKTRNSAMRRYARHAPSMFHFMATPFMMIKMIRISFGLARFSREETRVFCPQTYPQNTFRSSNSAIETTRPNKQAVGYIKTSRSSR